MHKNHKKHKIGLNPSQPNLKSKLDKFFQEYKVYFFVIVLFIIFFGIYAIPINKKDKETTQQSVLRIESIDVCEGFDSVKYQTVGCNHIFSDTVENLIVFYYVSFNESPKENLSIDWHYNEELIQKGQNDFTNKGKPVEPGEYLLAMQSDFDLEVGNYKIVLSEGDHFLGFVAFTIVPNEDDDTEPTQN